MRLKPLLEKDMQENGQETLFRDTEMPLMPVLAKMERHGVRLDTKALAESSRILNERLLRIEEEIYQHAGHPFTISSPRQVGEVLYGELKLVEKVKKTKSGQYSTDEATLDAMRSKHPIVGSILEYRGLRKLISTYVEALPQMLSPVDGNLHSSFNQSVTATGRLSSSNPNLQNIPVRGEDGREMRRAFVPDEGSVFLSADYSQIELRLMAHLSGDENLIRDFVEGKDIHAATAARIFKKPLEEVDRDERRKAKTANFGIIYGISAFGLSQRLRIPRAEAKQLIDGYFESYPKVKEYMDNVVATAREKGYVETLFGRRRYLADIDSRNANARALAERNAINAPIQGTAADIMKLAMVGVARRFKAEGVRSRITMQVHDEIVVDLLRSEREQVEKIVREEMEGAAKLSIPLTAECGVGENWLDAH
jgi:DNA polymerase-1